MDKQVDQDILFCMMASEDALRKDWDSEEDKVWDDVAANQKEVHGAMAMTQSVLAKAWSNPEEDKAWKDL